ncbi:amidohydrolase family protein [Streptomyces caniscabiei]|uniref:Amidohydrolase family protein n=1 Tax=Streptomyces caniscabiei TaxID=2746961 RepID=A0A927L040_9ACTN|nr:amidohydrolase family protein [Streptomyces caniscabiei]MBD9722481.1 amidohydrolase family protein [Streptomyces caniscabiei]MDX3515151.1 amidohydrolase family protein [Streptomyces caniscabiei]MDX3716567.1 amidohydrolase family protein [Streptomyces caniscabiei]MDX3731997.1 amidohydrolase family protein [Streptomyces caniscabiei]WEO22457.1 amidohydrolase family protein [Streptomyces caniscabiei]
MEGNTAEGLIDAHHHVWDLSVRDQDWITGPELVPLHRDFLLVDLEPEARTAGVTATVLVQTIDVPEETPEFLALAQDSDLVAGVVGWTDLTSPDVSSALAALREGPGGEHLVGIRHQVQGEADPRWLVRPDVLRGLAAVAEAGLVYELVVRPRQLAAAHEAALRLPGLTFVLDHAGKPPIASGELRPWADAVCLLASLPNTVCKLSGMVTEADWDQWSVEDLRPYANTVLEAFGPRRLMFGSDWPVCRLAATYTEVISTARELTAALQPAERHEVFTGTARRTYGRTLTGSPAPQEAPCA